MAINIQFLFDKKSIYQAEKKLNAENTIKIKMHQYLARPERKL